MPKNRSVEILKRWMDLDLLLAHGDATGEGVILSKFAKDHGVSKKTVRRDIEAFAELGYQAACMVTDGGEDHHGNPVDVYRWAYLRGVDPMFANTVYKMDR